jgi:hypothetical protein
VSLTKKRNPRPSSRIFGVSQAELEEQRINFAFGNAPEGATSWVTRASLKKAAINRFLVSRKDRAINR